MIDILIEKIKKNEGLNKSYLFYGRDKSYLRDMALKFSKAISNTLDGTLILGDNKKIIGVNDIRYLKQEILKKSIFGNNKVIIIDNSDSMSIEAQNALLKTLEDQVYNTYIILIVKNLNNILKTVISRCILVNFDLELSNSNRGYLEGVLYNEGVRNLYNLILNSLVRISYRDFIGFSYLVGEFKNYKDLYNEVPYIMYLIIRDIFIYKEIKDDRFILNKEFINDIKEISDNYRNFQIDNIINEIRVFKDRLDVNLNFELCYKIFILKIGR